MVSDASQHTYAVSLVWVGGGTGRVGEEHAADTNTKPAYPKTTTKKKSFSYPEHWISSQTTLTLQNMNKKLLK